MISLITLLLSNFMNFVLMKQKTVARQYVSHRWYGQPLVPISKKQCKRAPRVPGEPPILKSLYLLKKQSNVRDSLSIVCKCMRTSSLTCCLPCIACL